MVWCGEVNYGWLLHYWLQVDTSYYLVWNMWDELLYCWCCHGLQWNARKCWKVVCTLQVESDFIGELLLFLLCSTTFGLWFASGSCSCLYSLMVCAWWCSHLKVWLWFWCCTSCLLHWLHSSLVCFVVYNRCDVLVSSI